MNLSEHECTTHPFGGFTLNENGDVVEHNINANYAKYIINV